MMCASMARQVRDFLGPDTLCSDTAHTCLGGVQSDHGAQNTNFRRFTPCSAMGLIRNLTTAFTAAGLWVVGMPFVVRSRMNGYVERVCCCTRPPKNVAERA